MSRPLLDDAVLKLIDAKLVINGNVTTKDVYFHTGLCRQKVSRVFQDYLAQNPNSMVHVPAKRKYIATESFKPHFLGDTDAKAFIDALVVVFGTYEPDDVEIKSAINEALGHICGNSYKVHNQRGFNNALYAAIGCAENDGSASHSTKKELRESVTDYPKSYPCIVTFEDRMLECKRVYVSIEKYRDL